MAEARVQCYSALFPGGRYDHRRHLAAVGQWQSRVGCGVSFVCMSEAPYCTEPLCSDARVPIVVQAESRFDSATYL